MVSPFKTTKKLVTIDTMSLDWGQLVGSIPSKAQSGREICHADRSIRSGAAAIDLAGIDKLAIDLDLGAAWTESSNSFALTPATLDIGGIAKAQCALRARQRAARACFRPIRPRLMGQAARIEAGTLEFSLRDSGVVDLVVAQFSRMQNVSRDAARRRLVESIKARREQVASANPDANAAVTHSPASSRRRARRCPSS